MRKRTAFKAYRDGDAVVINYNWLDRDTVEVKIITRNGKVGKFKVKHLHEKKQEILEDGEVR